ncbi:MAG TPA: hypothetical protein VKA46_37795 [Gemmataceae bacterium]|nr:hypothetical protein [Gemmataceae bacterium]
MESSAWRTRIADALWLVAWGVLSSAWCVTAAGELGATFDEPLYLTRGLEGWRTGSHAGLIRVGTMPLPIDVQTLPLYLRERASGTKFDTAADCDTLLRWARAGTLPFWWLLLLYGLLAGRQIGGPWGGRLAVTLLACEPSLLAHAALATTDIAVSAAVLALVYHFRTGRERGWCLRVLVPSAWLAAAILSKASGLVFGSICLLAVECERQLRQVRERGEGWPALWRTFGPFRRDAAQVVGLGLLLTFTYCGSDWQPEPSFVAWAHQLPEGRSASVVVWLADHLRIFSNAGEGIIRQVRHNVRGHGVFLLGEVHPRALWYYFPVALSIKLTLPLLLLPPLLAAVRPSALRNWACAAAGALLLFSLTCRVQIGIRLMLPLVALAVAGLAGAAANACRWPAAADEKARRGRFVSFSPSLLLCSALPFVLGASVLWAGVSAALVWPRGLCYTNEAWGGTERGYLRLSDSNYDWGQGVKELALWQKDHGNGPLDVWYFGSDPAVLRPPLHYVALHAPPPGSPVLDVREQVRGHRLAVSTTLLYGMPCDTEEYRQASGFLRGCTPMARTSTFLIYDFSEPCAAAAP